MKVYFDEIGYPAEFDIQREVEELAKISNNYYILERIMRKITPVIQYWTELQPYYEKRQHGKITKTRYKQHVTRLQKKYFSDDLGLRKMLWTV